MTRTKRAALAACALTLLLAGAFRARGANGAAMPQTESQSSAATAPVFLELFTSEGCSSCPPADALLSQLIRKRAIPGVEVIAVAWHVDYWDNLGWKDPLSTRAATDRQNAYATLLKQRSVYTPEMIVEGQEGFVGSDGATAQRVLKAAAQTPIARIALKISGDAQAGKGRLEAAIPALDSLAPGETASVLFALTEDGIEHAVGAGENDGRKLHHDAAARLFSKIGAISDSATGKTFSADWNLPPGVRAEHSRLVVWVQAPGGRILAAGQFPLTAS